jgi:mannose-1-phosphate guanylyltransferase/mannose-6-phosphate isomerase
MSVVYPVVLSGGSGTRLWPLSRAMQPKQFLRLRADKQATLFGETLTRLPQGEDFAAPILLCNNDHRFLVDDECEKLAVSPAAIVLEPMARNTAPAIAVAALLASRQNADAIIAVMPSDHVVEDGAGFIKGVREAASIAADRKLVLLGITPSEPHTGYGYIHRGARRAGPVEAYDVAAFVEKPDRATAEGYVRDGGYLWNSGIFVLHAATFLSELAAHEPNVLAAARAALQEAKEDLNFLRLDAKAFAASPSISVDYAVMEKTSAAVVLPLSVGWSDLGSWSSLWDIAKRDEAGNAANGDVVLHDTSDCYIHATQGMVSTVGVRDLVIVNTPDALLVADKSRAQDVSAVVADLKRQGRTQHEQHLRNARPWGFFETLNKGPRFQVKLLHVKPGGRLSTQMHHHRSEHWVVVQGTALVMIDGVEKLVRENESVYITATQWHRLENPGKVPLELIEVQLGTYLGEDDIIRSDDVYHRAPEETR